MSIQQHAIDLYDKFVAELEDRAYSMGEWNTLADAFLDKHVPKTPKRELILAAFYDHKDECLLSDVDSTRLQLTSCLAITGGL